MLASFFSNKKLVRRFFNTVIVLLILRAFSSIPTPGVNADYFQQLLSSNASFSFLNAITGNGLESLSVMTLSITPYITASIIMQLLGVVFKKIAEMQKGMKDERDRLKRITIVLGGGISFFEGFAMAYGFGKQGLLISFTWYWVLIVTVIWAVAAMLLSAVGKYMTDKHEKFIGNGVSLILMVNILSAFPDDIYTLYAKFIAGVELLPQIRNMIILVACCIGVLVFTVFVQNAEKKIPVDYVNKMAYDDSNKPQDYIPIKLCPGSVVPVIFASSILTFPIIIAELIGKGSATWLNFLNTSSWFQSDHMIYTIGAAAYIAMIFWFSFYYTEITINPEEMAYMIQKNGGNVAGVRAGTETAKFLRKEMRSTIFKGALALTIIAMIPIVIGGIFDLSRISFLGTSLIIVVGVLSETGKDLRSQAKGSLFMNQVRKGGLFFERKKRKTRRK